MTENERTESKEDSVKHKGSDEMPSELSEKYQYLRLVRESLYGVVY